MAERPDAVLQRALVQYSIRILGGLLREQVFISRTDESWNGLDNNVITLLTTFHHQYTRANALPKYYVDDQFLAHSAFSGFYNLHVYLVLYKIIDKRMALVI